MNLSKRLTAVAAMITEGSIIADIGTDHGYIPIAMAVSGKTPCAFAMDVKEGPLSRAKENILRYHVADIVQTRLSDGLTALKPEEAETIVIAGMGGLLMKKILTEGIEAAESAKELVLSPHSDVDAVRRFLGEHEFRIVDESIVFDEGKYYFIMKAVPHQKMELSEEACFFGPVLLKRRDPVLAEYLKQELEKCEAILRKIKAQAADDNRAESVMEKRNRLKRGLAICESV